MEGWERSWRSARGRRGWLLVIFLLTAGGYASAECTPLAVIVNPKNPVESLSSAQLRRLILGDVRNWPDGKPVNIVTREPSSKVAQCALSKVVRLSDAEYHRYLMNAEFRGEENVVAQVANSDPAAAKVVAGSISAFAVVDAASLPAISGSVKVLHINGKLPSEADYPL